ncbi:hypothetical protein GGF32_006525 [Allomyces javanicus]|nr:hypothetical protein GGF32_006525 [Allomyces javanicus]
MAVTHLMETVDRADTLVEKEPAQAAAAYLEVLQSSATGEEAVRAKEAAILKLGQLYRMQRAAKELAALLSQCRTFLVSLPKAKTAKIVRTLIDYFSDIPDSLALQVQVCKEAIDWAAEEKRIFLRQSLETRLAAMYLDHKMYTEALALIAQLLKELKRLDDKLVLVDVQLLESRVFHALRNLAKARASLTSARTAANSIYCPPVLQAGLDMQSGILHAEDKDFKTAYSYFYETLEGYASQDDARAVTALKYLLMSKIMLNAPEDVHSLAQQKVAVRFATTPEVAAMKAVAVALQHRSLLEFEQALSNFRAQLTEDPVVRLHLSALYDTLLEQNLLRIIEPYSRVEITHVAQLVKLPLQQVEQKLSQLILDGKLKGVLDQGACVLIVYEETQTDQTYHDALETVKKLGTVVDSLYQKARRLGQTTLLVSNCC